MDLDLPTATTHNVQLSVGKSGQLYVGIVSPLSATTDTLAFLWCTTNPTSTTGVNWTQVDATTLPTLTLPDVPAQDPGGVTDPLALLPSGQFSLGFSLAADPNSANFVYVGGGTQTALGNGVTGYNGRLFRIDASPTAAAPAPITDSGTAAPGSAPHAGSRVMAFDGSYLLEGDDGGVYAQTKPETAKGSWISLNGTGLAVTEMYGVAYDNVSHVIVASAQDVNTFAQIATGSTTWEDVDQSQYPNTATNGENDGGAVAVGPSTTPNESVRYTSSQNLANFQAQTVDANNNPVGQPTPLNSKGTVKAQFVTPVVVNAINGQALVAGGSDSVYESLDGGNTWTSLGAAADANAMAYGGYQGITAEPSVLWVATDNGVYLRPATGGALAQTAYAGAAALSVTVDSTDWTQAWVVDAKSQIWYTNTAGAAWTNITPVGSSAYVPQGLRTVLYISGKEIAGQLPKAGALLVGGSQGVYVTQSPTVNTASWVKLSGGLPAAP